MIGLDYVATALTILGLWANGKKYRWCWPVWILGNAFWIAHWLSVPDQGVSVALNVLFVVMNLKGFWEWSRPELHPTPPHA